MRRSRYALRNLCFLVTAEVITLIGIGIGGDAIDPNTRLIIFKVASYIGVIEFVVAAPLLCYETYKCCRTRNAAEAPAANVLHTPPPATILSNVPASTPSSSELASSPPSDYTAGKKGYSMRS